MDILKFIPIYQPRVWGGRDLQKKLGRELPENEVIGESWEIVDRPEAQSVVKEGILSGITIREVIEIYGSDVMGPEYNPERPFPVLVKWLDCQDRLSLQVHPPATVASELNGEPKTENWYIVETDQGAALLAGLVKGVTRDQFAEGLKNNTAEALTYRVLVEPGDSLFVPSGRIHAIDAGNLILEIQQNSDSTYRVYDWDRVGLDGKPRQLHIEESLKSIDFDDFEPEIIKALPEDQILADSEEFRIRKLIITESIAFVGKQEPRLLHVVQGKLVSDSGSVVQRGDNVLIPWSLDCRLNVDGEKAVVLVTDSFA